MFEFKLFLNGRLTTISFYVEGDYRLVKPLVDLQAPDLNLFRVASVTICTIDDGINKVYGVALQSKLDDFDEETGRKLALERALKTKGYSKNARRVVWWYYRRAVEKEMVKPSPFDLVMEATKRDLIRNFKLSGARPPKAQLRLQFSKEPSQA